LDVGAESGFMLADSSSGSIIFWLLVLLVLIVLGFLAAMFVKRWLMDSPEEPRRAGFTLSDLRQMHKNGQMTDEQFERARQRIISASKAVPGTTKPIIPQPPAAGGPPPGEL
jgi:hypothetical protein